MKRRICLRNVSVKRGARCVVSALSLTLEPGEWMGVLGPNGAGKSSLLSACTGELPVASGSIQLDEQTLDPNNALQLARVRAVLPQQSQLAFGLSVREIIQMGAYAFPEHSEQQVSRWCDRAVAAVDLHMHLDQPYHALSGGEQQRVQFARVMVQALAIQQASGHAYLFLDEPTASLDPRHQGLLMRVVKKLVTEENMGAMAVLHDLNMAARWCDKIVLLSPDHPPRHGPVSEMLTQETLESVYGMAMQIVRHPVRLDAWLILPHE